MSKIVRASYRARREHPFLVWKALMRLRVLDKLSGEPERYYGRDDIGNALYTNWSDLTDDERFVVWIRKLSYTMSFLAFRSYAIPQTTPVKRINYSSWGGYDYVQQPLEMWKARESVFSDTYTSSEEVDEFTREVMDQFWGEWIHRREAVRG